MTSLTAQIGAKDRREQELIKEKNRAIARLNKLSAKGTQQFVPPTVKPPRAKQFRTRNRDAVRAAKKRFQEFGNPKKKRRLELAKKLEPYAEQAQLPIEEAPAAPTAPEVCRNVDDELARATTKLATAPPAAKPQAQAELENLEKVKRSFSP